MTKDQKAVAAGAIGGIAGMIATVWFFTAILPAPIVGSSSADRIAYTLPWLALAVTPLWAMLAAIGNARFSSEAIDPTLGRENPKMTVDARVAANTLEQFVVFATATLALCVNLPTRSFNLIAAAAITFVLARIVFWVGYRVHPLRRAPGFAATAYLNLGLLLAALWLWIV